MEMTGSETPVVGREREKEAGREGQEKEGVHWEGGDDDDRGTFCFAVLRHLQKRGPLFCIAPRTRTTIGLALVLAHVLKTK